MTSEEITRKHIVACTCVPEAACCWGIAPELAFPFWDWVGGRYSVTSCVGHLPIALAFGGGVFDDFLEGCHAMDTHFTTAPPERNLPMMLGCACNTLLHPLNMRNSPATPCSTHSTCATHL